MIRNNLFTGLAANGRALQILESPQDITIDHNTFAYTGGHALIMFDGDPADRFVLTNNILQLGDYGIFGSGQGSGKPALTYYAPKNQISNNVLVGSSAVAPSYPPCNQYLDTNSSVGFVSFSTANYRLNSNSRFQNYATDRKAVGADINAVMQAAKLAGVL